MATVYILCKPHMRYAVNDFIAAYKHYQDVLESRENPLYKSYPINEYETHYDYLLSKYKLIYNAVIFQNKDNERINISFSIKYNFFIVNI